MNREEFKQAAISAAASFVLFLRTHPTVAVGLGSFLLGVFVCAIIH